MIRLADRKTTSANQVSSSEVHIVVCTSGTQHLLDSVPIEQSLYYHSPRDAEPPMLGFECQTVLRDRWGNYDYYGYLEDDLILHDAWFFQKLIWFNRCVGRDKLLQPNRYERGTGTRHHKVYLDGDLAPHVTAPIQCVDEEGSLESNVMGVPVVFQRPLNPHSGCFFLTAEQMQHWTSQPHFGTRDTSFIGPLESAATLGIMKTFQVYKPAREYAGFLEVEHYGNSFVRLINRDNSLDA